MTSLIARAPFARGLALVATPTLAVGLMTSAAAAGAAGYYVGQNTTEGATVMSADGSTSHQLGSQLRAVAGDGSVHVLSAKVTPTRTAAVVVDGESGIGRIVTVDPKDAKIGIYAGNGAVVVHADSKYSLRDIVTGASTMLSGPPEPVTGSSVVTAVTGTVGGALVATEEVSADGLSSTHIWKLTTSAFDEIAQVGGQRTVAVAATGNRIDAILKATGDGALTHMTIGDGGTTEQPMNLALTPGVSAVDLGYAHQGDVYSPVLALTGADGTKVYDMAGQLLHTYSTESRVFISADDLRNPTSISNRLTTIVALEGVRDNQVVAHGGKVTPTVTAATGYALLPPSVVPARLTVKVGSNVRVGTSGTTISLTRNTCFTGSAAGTFFISPAKPVTRCVDVKHRVQKVSFNRRNRATVVATSAARLQVQVLKNNRWDTVQRVAVTRGRAKFIARRGKVRVVAVATPSNVSSTLLITRR